MNDMSLITDNPADCRDCGARNAPGTARCWLCGAALHWPSASAKQAGAVDRQRHDREEPESEEYADVELVPERPYGSRFSYSITTIFAAMTIVAIAAGFLGDSNQAGIGILVLMVGLPALLITTIRMSRLRAKGDDVTWTNRLLTFFLSSLAVAGTIVLLAVAAIMALFIYCLVLCSTGKF